MADTNTGGGNTGPNKQNVQDAEDMADAFNEIKTDLVDIAAIFNTMAQSMRGQSAYAKSQKETVKSLAQELNKAAKYVDVTRKNQAGLGKEYESSKKVQERVNQIKNRQLSIENTILQLERQGITLNKSQIASLNAAIAALKKQEEIEESLLEKAQRREKAIGKMGKLFQGLTKIPVVGQLVDAERIQDKINKKAEETGNRWKSFGAGLKETFLSIRDSLTDPFVLIGGLISGFVKLVKLAAEYQSKQFEAAKDLGVSVERGKQLRDSFVDLARANASLGVTADQLQKSYAGVQDQLGFIVKQSQEFNLSTALIERRTGASAENMALLQFAAKKTGDTLMGTYKTISGITKETGARVKLELSEKQVLEEVGKVSATVYQNFNGNFKALTAAVIQAKALGTTLDKINATQDQFLDFESSIAKQFEAEVLSGEQLDLTRARQLALNHDTKGLMLEINKLIGDNAKFNAMDSITQKSKAEALGLSREAVAEMLRDQEKANVLGAAAGADLQTQYELLVKQRYTRKQIVDTLGQQAAQSAQQASVSEKLAATLDAIKNTIAQAAQVLIPMVDKVTTWLSKMENLKKVFAGIVGLMAAMASYSLIIKTAGAISLMQTTAQLGKVGAVLAGETAIAGAKSVQAGADIARGSWYLGPGAIAVGAAAIATLLGYLTYSTISSATGGGTTPNAPPAGGGSTAIPDTGMSTVPTVTPSTSTNSATYSATGTNVTSRDGKSVGDVYLDGSKVGQIIFKTANQQQLNMV